MPHKLALGQNDCISSSTEVPLTADSDQTQLLIIALHGFTSGTFLYPSVVNVIISKKICLWNTTLFPSLTSQQLKIHNKCYVKKP